MLTKILFTALVIGCVWMLSMRLRRTPKASGKVARVKTVKCAVCGVYLPQDEAHPGAHNTFRCDEHRVP